MRIDTEFYYFSFFPIVVTKKCKHTGTMAPKDDPSKLNIKKKSAPKFDCYLINEETSELNYDLIEYPMKKKAQLRETLPRGTKTSTKVVTYPKKTIRIKQLSTSSPHSA